jgi:hypothetical protein
MIRQLGIGAGVLMALALLASQAHAQAMGFGAGGRGHAFGRPTVSPYLNLIASDVLSQTVGTAGGYQTLVRPFVDGRRAINANSAAISQLQQSQGAFGAAAGGGGGGRAGAYMNYSHYYPALSGR